MPLFFSLLLQLQWMTSIWMIDMGVFHPSTLANLSHTLHHLPSSAKRRLEMQRRLSLSSPPHSLPWSLILSLLLFLLHTSPLMKRSISVDTASVSPLISSIFSIHPLQERRHNSTFLLPPSLPSHPPVAGLISPARRLTVHIHHCILLPSLSDC